MAAKKTKTKVQTSYEIVVSGLKRGKTNADVLARVMKVHPKSTMGLATVNWYRCRLREQGFAVGSDREAKRKA